MNGGHNVRTLFLRAWPGAYSAAALATVAIMVDAWLYPQEARGDLGASVTVSLLLVLIPTTLVAVLSGVVGSVLSVNGASRGLVLRVLVTTGGGGVVSLLPPFVFAGWMLPVGVVTGMVAGLIINLGLTPRQLVYWGVVGAVGLSAVLVVIALRWLT